MRRKMRFTAFPVAALCLGLLCLGLLSVGGCGPGSGAPKTVKAKFKAAYEDGTALPPMVILALHPEAGAAKYTVGASTPVDGEYALSTSYEGGTIDGAPPGKYKVVVRGTMAPPGGAAAAPHPDCADEKTTPLKIEVSDSGTVSPNPLKIPLAKK